MALSKAVRFAVRKIEQYGTLVMFSHTIFSLSFGLIAMLLASGGLPEPRKVVIILVALLAARTGANALNRAIDAEIDAKNPRTATRQLPQKAMGKREVVSFSVVCFAIMVAMSAMLNPLCFALSPVALALMVGYSYTKRFTWLCHLILGVTTACAPVGAWLAITGQWAWLPLFMGAANAAWVAGFDIIYGAQDVEFDRANGLHSIPARFGVKGGLWISTLLHGGAVGCLIIVGLLSPQLGPIYFTGLVLVAGLLVAEHVMVSPQNLTNVKIASYGINQIVSVVFLLAGLIDVFF